MRFDFSPLLRGDVPAPAAPWTGFPEFNFVGGNNDADSIPVDGLAAAMARALAREGRSLATYKMDSGPLGHRGLREFVASTLGRHAGLDCSPDQVLVVSGSLQALDLVNAALVEPGDTVVVEARSYGGALSRLRRCGAELVGVDVDEAGMRVDELADALGSLRDRGVRPKYVYTIPTVQNPTGTVMSLERRQALLRVAGDHDVAVFEDDCYADLLWAGDRPPALRAMDASGRVIYCGTFSKSIAPALRVGYVVADPAVLGRLIALKTDGGTGALEQMALAEFGPQRFDAHVSDLRGVLREKCEVMMEALAEHFGAAAEFRPPSGGIFIWVTLPDTVDTSALAEAALAEGVAINPGAEWSADAGSGCHSLRLCFGQATVEQIRAGIARLADVCHRETGIPERSANVQRTTT